MGKKPNTHGPKVPYLEQKDLYIFNFPSGYSVAKVKI